MDKHKITNTLNQLDQDSLEFVNEVNRSCVRTDLQIKLQENITNPIPHFCPSPNFFGENINRFHEKLNKFILR